MSGFVPFIVAIVVIVALIIGIRALVRYIGRKRNSYCSACKEKYNAEDIEFFASDLKWEAETKQEKHGDFTYDVSYRVFYRMVTIKSTCHKCHEERFITFRVNVYRSDSKFSQSDAEEYNVLRNKIRGKLSGYFEKDIREGIEENGIDICFV